MNSELERVAPKKANYEWYQDKKFVKIRIPISGTSSKKIDVFISDLILKVNVTEKNFVVIFDLQHKIEFTSKETRFVYSNGVLEVTLQKEIQGKEWSDLLVQGLSKDQIRQRRQESFKRQEEKMKEFVKTREDLRHQYDSKATREQMDQEDRERNRLRSLQKEEKEAAEEQVFGGGENSNNNNNKKEGPKDGITAETEYVYARKVESDIFSARDLQNYEIQMKEASGQIPQPRKANTVNVQFTEKIYPNIAVREQHFKDAPMPKMMHQKIQQGSDVDQKNPLWLKDKGDEFFKNKDYFSALNAYTQAYKLDSNYIESLANKIAVQMHLFGYDEVMVDCEKVLEFLENLKDDEKKEKYVMLKVKTLLRLAIAQSWRGKIEVSLETFQKLLDFAAERENERKKLPENILKQVTDCQKLVLQRQEAIKIKKLGDLKYEEANYLKALEFYQQALEVDKENETAMGNISVTLLQMKNNQECIKYCDMCLEKILKITQFTNNNPSFRSIGAADHNQFLLKLYLRKSKALLNLNETKAGFESIKKAIALDEQNKEARQIYNSLEKQMTLEKVQELKKEAAEFMKQKKIKEALDIYNESLKILDSNETIEYLALLLNRCACYLHLEKYEDIVSSSLRGLKIIRSQKNRVLCLDGKQNTKETREKLLNFELRFLVRRSNAYLKQNLIFNAKNDLIEALKLDPENEQLKKDLNELESNLLTGTSTGTGSQQQ